LSTQSASQQIQAMAEEIFELQKLSWIGQASNEEKDEFDLSESEFLTLDMLVKNDSMTVGELQRSIGVLPAQMSRVIRNLERKAKKPLVNCALNPEDKRKIDVSISPTGQKAHRGYQAMKVAKSISVLSELDEDDRVQLMRLLGLIREKLMNLYLSKRD
jgi:DNA-binding MarR family transcriptional regulator